MITRVLALVLFGVVAAACGPADQAPDDVAAPPPPPEATPDPSPTEEVPTTGWGPDAVPIELPGGWEVRDCEGDAPLLCVEHGGQVVGTLYLDSFPLTDAMAAADDEGALRSALRDYAASRHDGMAADRAAGCGEAYAFAPEDVLDVTVAGLPGVRHGFRGTEDGRLTEHVLSYATVASGQLWVTVAEAAAEDGCMADPEMDLFAPDTLVEFTPLLDRLVAATTLPAAGTRIEDGTIVGVDGGLDGGLVYVLVDGFRHRVQQPRPMTEQDVRDEGLTLGTPVVRVEATGTSTGSSFVVLPADGPQARLHLLQDGVLHPVTVQAVQQAAVEGIPDAERPVLDDLRPVRLDA